MLAGDILGCTDPAALNYNPDANVDDGNCDYGEGTCVDIDGNIYDTVIIGTQTWMAENLKVTHYRNGDPIPTGHTNCQWEGLSTDAFTVYPWDASQNTCGDDCNSDCEGVYGNLYNWYAVDDSREVCPESWHVPSDEEWTVLTDYLGGESIAGGKMKATGTIEGGDGLWYSPNFGANDEVGFAALPGGWRSYYDGTYIGMGYDGYFWSSTAYIYDNAYHRFLVSYSSEVGRSNYSKRSAYSVRCVGDAD